jgi:chemotaxis response regulator CheB
MLATTTEAAVVESERLAPSFPVAGLVASAGGLDAFKKFFAAMPADSDVAFVLIPHLDPKHESLLVDLLARCTKMPVVEAADRMVVEANRIYLPGVAHGHRLRVVVTGPRIQPFRRPLVPLRSAQLVRFRIQQAVERLFHRGPDHLVHVATDLPLINFSFMRNYEGVNGLSSMEVFSLLDKR